ncbi:MAG: hypothetical protein MK080_05280 [Opitutales bacterium]|nr:hypothetical protein [Opitutales bacterium]NRA27604.1 hypothetical protein [Opitutales bacterium]
MHITLKELPADLHKRLKNMAEINGRSLNRQIIHLLAAATSPQKTNDADLLHRIRLNRERNRVPISQEFLQNAIKDGRS